MSERKDLRQLSKKALIDMIFSRDEKITLLESRLQKVEHFLKAFDNAHTPSSKKLKTNTSNEELKEDPESTDDKTDEDSSDKKKPRFPGKPAGSNGGGIQLPKPDKIVEHKLDFCPISKKPLGEPIGYRIKTIIDFQDKPIQTIEN